MLAANTVHGVRIVSTPAALDTMVVPPHKTVLRTAPDEAMILHCEISGVSVPDDPHAIVEEEHGFSLISVSWNQFEQFVRPRIEWRVPSERPTLAQGLIAFIPCKLWLAEDGVRIVVATAFANTLLERIR